MNAMVPETYFTVNQELVLLFYSVVLGVLIGVIYDMFRAIRSIVRHSFAAVFIEDCVFFAIYSVLLVCFAVMFARSQVRFYYAVGNFAGFALYHYTLGNFFVGIFRKIALGLKAVISKLCSFIMNNAQKFASKIVKNAEIVRIRKEKNANILQNEESVVYNENGLLFDDIDKRRNTEYKNKREAKKSGKVRRKKKG